MGRYHRCCLVAAAVAVLAAAGAAPAGAESTVAASPGPTTVSAYRGVVAWSSAVGGGKFKLTARIAGRVRILPVRSRGVPFDVDLGPGPDGHVTAVYSRCRREPDYVVPGGSLPQPNYSRGRGCDIYRYDFSTRRESAIAVVNGRASSEYMPSIWRNRIAFARVYERRRGRAGVVTWVYTRKLDDRGRSSRVPAGPWGHFDMSDALQLPRGAGGAGVTGIDLGARHLALGWEYRALIHGMPGDATYQILLDTLADGRQRVVATLSTPDELANFALFAPTLSNGFLTYGDFFTSRDPSSVLVRYSIDRRSREHAVIEGDLVSQATVGTTTFTVQRSGDIFAVTEQRGLAYARGSVGAAADAAGVQVHLQLLSGWVVE